MEEIENVLGIRSYPMNWPIGTDGNYRGVYDRQKKQIEFFDEDASHGQEARTSVTGSLDDPEIKDLLGGAFSRL